MRLVYLSGEPGTGKSWLMAQLTDALTRQPLDAEPGAPARDLLTWTHPEELTPRVVAVELGRRRDSFSGTDALPSAVIEEACTYLTSGRAEAETPLLLAEGARLANRRFLCTAALSGAQVILMHLMGPEVAAARRAARAAELGVPEQNPSWVKGRRTAAENLARELATDSPVHVLGVDAADPPVPLMRDLLSLPH
jgi:hypothetical protein